MKPESKQWNTNTPSDKDVISWKMPPLNPSGLSTMTRSFSHAFGLLIPLIPLLRQHHIRAARATDHMAVCHL